MVLNNRTEGRVPISEETRERVIEAAANLGYAPNPVAQMPHGNPRFTGTVLTRVNRSIPERRQ